MIGKLQFRWVFLTGLMVADPGYSDSHDEMTLCEPTETVVFSCVSSREGTDPFHSTAISRKVISLCATPGVSANSGALIYRLGADKGHIELTYPKQPLAPAGAFTVAFQSWAKGSESRVSFIVGQYSYTLYNRVAVYDEHPRSNGGGVQVTRQGKLVSDRWCDGEERSSDIEDHIWEMVSPLKLPQTGRTAAANNRLE
jgi:hypothetical protein